MNLVISSRVGLERHYGDGAFDAVRDALDAYVAASGSSSIVAFLDVAESMAPLGLQPISSTTSGSVLAGVRAVRRMLPTIDSVFIVGNDHVVPYWQFTNPVGDRRVDPDAIVYSDNPYGTTSDTLEDYLAPPIAVGRLADSASGSIDDFITALTACTENHNRRRIVSDSAAVVNDEWFDVTLGVINELAPPVSAWRTPTFQIGPANRGDINRRYLYFNLHGFLDDPAWKGFDDRRAQFFTVATPDSFERSDVSGSIVFAENCYGALTPGKDLANSCALKLLHEGAAALVGATGLAFGSHIAPNALLENADFLAQQFFARACAGASTCGAALVGARRDYRDVERTPMTNAFKQKTLMQFTLLGDPSLN